MKALVTYNRVCAYLGKIFDLLNKSYFENSLSKPIITIQSAPGMGGRYSPNGTWTVDDDMDVPELNVSAESLSSPIEYVVAALLHEMVHYDLDVKGIQSSSRGGTYHNKRFRDRAQECDLIVNQTPKGGWSETLPSDNLVQFCIDHALQDIRIHRVSPPAVEPRKKSSSRKYVCPGCGASFRATSDLRVSCMDCNKQFVQDN